MMSRWSQSNTMATWQKASAQTHPRKAVPLMKQARRAHMKYSSWLSTTFVRARQKRLSCAGRSVTAQAGSTSLSISHSTCLSNCATRCPHATVTCGTHGTQGVIAWGCPSGVPPEHQPLCTLVQNAARTARMPCYVLEQKPLRAHAHQVRMPSEQTLELLGDLRRMDHA